MLLTGLRSVLFAKVILLLVSSPVLAAIVGNTLTPDNSTSLDNESRFSIESLGKDWGGFFATVLSTLPWAIVAVFDAIDEDYRTPFQVAIRLSAATVFLTIAYVIGIMSVIAILLDIYSDESPNRHDEIATITALLLFNLYHVARNIRGWSQFFAIRKIATSFELIQTNFLSNFPVVSDPSSSLDSSDSHSRFIPPKSPHIGGTKLCIQRLEHLRISHRLIDNDWRLDTPFLNPFFRFRLQPGPVPALSQDEEKWAIALWKAFWTQNTVLLGHQPDLSAPPGFRCDRPHRKNGVENLIDTDPSALPTPYNAARRVTPLPPVTHQTTGMPITTKLEWANALLTYGSIPGEEPEGQQDTHGAHCPPIMRIYDASAVAVLVYEKTLEAPHRMTALWYNTARFEDFYQQKAISSFIRSDHPDILFPTWSNWIKIAHDIASHSSRPMSMTDRSLVTFAGELASTSLILVRYPKKYHQLVTQIYRDGLNARWTFGWSGLLACFSHLWTRERIYVVMLNGLSLLAMDSNADVDKIDPNVRSMLYGYAAFAVSERAVGKRICHDRKHELLKRYKENKGKTCRGSGLCATRIACRVLGIPAEASHMDGLPAFSTGWAGEFLEFKPGNQAPQHGLDHDQVECLQGSSNAYRYPNAHS